PSPQPRGADPPSCGGLGPPLGARLPQHSVIGTWSGPAGVLFAKPYKRGGRQKPYSAETIEAKRKGVLGYRENMRGVVEHDIPVNAKPVADLRALATWPGDLILEIHVDLDPRLSVVRVERDS